MMQIQHLPVFVKKLRSYIDYRLYRAYSISLVINLSKNFNLQSSFLVIKSYKLCSRLLCLLDIHMFASKSVLGMNYNFF